jgi:hypothetical protein
MASALFVFGTLRDPDVMRAVLGRSLPAAELVPARLPGWRRLPVLNASYPVIRRDPARTTDGLLFEHPTPRDWLRIRHFESEEYDTLPVSVMMADGRRRPANVFAALEGIFEVGDGDWDLGSWARIHKATFLERCAGWMADCPELAPV